MKTLGWGKWITVTAVIGLVMIASSSSAYAAGNPVFHMSYTVHNWRGDIADAEPEMIEEQEATIQSEPTAEIPMDEEEPDPTEETPVDTEELELAEEIIVEAATSAEEFDTEEITPVEIEQITPALKTITASPIEEQSRDITIEEPIYTETEGEIINDESTKTMEPEG